MRFFQILSFLFICFFLPIQSFALGELDIDFAGDGTIINDFSGVSGFDEANAVAVDSQGRVVIAGHLYTGTQYNSYVARYDSAGNLDSSFASGGIFLDIANPYTSGKDDVAYTLVLDANDDIFVGGYYSASSSNDVIYLSKIDENTGTLDSTFASGVGVATLDLVSGEDHLNDIVIDNTGRIVGVGSSDDGNKDILIIVWDSAGNLDTGFSGDGIIDDAILGTSDHDTWSVDVDTSDNILIAGYYNLSGDNYGYIMAILANGSAVVPGFGATLPGLTAIATVGVDHSIYSTHIDSQNRIYFAGTHYDGTSHLLLGRLDEFGAFDTSFSTDGLVTLDLGNAGTIATSLLVDDQDRVLVSGYYETSDTTGIDVFLARFDEAGDLDPDFGSGDGFATGDIANGDELTFYARSLGFDSTRERYYVGGLQSVGFLNADAILYAFDATECGNGILEAGETCDDSNTTDGDGCSALCAPEAASPSTGTDATDSGDTESEDEASGDDGAGGAGGGGCTLSAKSTPVSFAGIFVVFAGLLVLRAFKNLRKN